ncbi:MAG: DNA mismatch repair protein MutT [Patescibacteria group bacterium]
MENKFAVALFLKRPGHEDEFLAVKRPPEDKGMPLVWGLPAVTINKDELPEEMARRVGREKLNTGIEPVSIIGVGSADQGDWTLVLMVIEARLVGVPPDVTRAITKYTKYTEQKWTSDFSILKEAAVKGSLCTRILLQHKGIDWT